MNTNGSIADASPSLVEGVRLFEECVLSTANPSTSRTYRTGLRTWLKSCAESNIDCDGLLLEELESSVCLTFIQWLSRARKAGPGKIQKQQTVPRFRERTIELYATALLKALDFWREEGHIGFTAAGEKRRRLASTIRSRKDISQYGRADLVDEHYGERMLSAVFSIPMPSRKRMLDRLEVLRARALVCLFYSTALRVSDVCRLTRLELARVRAGGGLLEKRMKKTGRKAYVYLSDFTQKAVKKYLDAREDCSPYLLISHGRGKRRSPSFLGRQQYGAPLSVRAARRIVKWVAGKAYPQGNAGFIAPHAFRHWHGQRLRLMGAPLDQIQAVLGHSSPAVTEKIYAPLPNRENIEGIERKLQNTFIAMR